MRARPLNGVAVAARSQSFADDACLATCRAMCCFAGRLSCVITHALTPALPLSCVRAQTAVAASLLRCIGAACEGGLVGIANKNRSLGRWPRAGPASVFFFSTLSKILQWKILNTKYSCASLFLPCRFSPIWPNWQKIYKIKSITIQKARKYKKRYLIFRIGHSSDRFLFLLVEIQPK